MIHIYSGCQNNVPIGEALVASAVVRLPILSVLRLAPQNSSTKCLCSSRQAQPWRQLGLKALKQFGRLAPRKPVPQDGVKGSYMKMYMFLAGARSTGASQNAALRAGKLQFSRFASPRPLYKMVKNRLLRKPQEPLHHLDSGTYL